jgi:N-acetyl-gamma-glutamylphosphate reductase
MSSIDNLIKGAAGQAIQAWNVANAREETFGLPLTGVTP